MMVKLTAIALTSLILVTGLSLAGEIEDLARDAEAKARAGQHAEAVETLRRALTELSAKGPLTLRRVQFIAAPPKGFGIYQPRANHIFRMRGAVDHLCRACRHGLEEFGRFEFASHEQNQEVMTHLTITLSGAPRGQNVLHATYRDRVANKSANLELAFEIR
jgi:hypothetical protein